MKINFVTTSINRKKILKKMFPESKFIAPDYNEKNSNKSFFPSLIARKNSYRKLLSVKKKWKKDTVMISMDTIIYRNFTIFNKTENFNEALVNLMLLSGKKHKAVTAVSILYKNKIITFTVKSLIKMRKYNKKEIMKYLKLKEHQNRAGSYAIQKNGKEFLIEYYKHDYFNIVGIPLYKLKNYITLLT